MASSSPGEIMRIVLVDDHVLFREGLRSLLERWEEVEVVGEAGTGDGAIALTRRLAPDVVVMDIGMPDISGLDATRTITREMPQVKVLVLTIHATAEHFFEALDAGARGYVLKEAASSDLRTALDTVYQGGLFLYPSVAQRVITEYLKRVRMGEERSSYELLTAREKEVLRLVGDGYTSQEIAQELTISVNTVQTHRLHIMEKLNLHSRAELMRYAVRIGLFPRSSSQE